MLIRDLAPECLAIIYSFLLGSYSYYDSSSVTGSASASISINNSNSGDDQNQNSESSSLDERKITQKFVTMDIIGSSIFPLKHSCRDLYWKLHDNALIWDHSIIPFPDVLSSKYLKFVDKLVEGGVSDGELIDSADSIYELFNVALMSICNLELIKKVSVSRLIRANYKNMDYTMFIMKLLPNIEELYLNVLYSEKLAVFQPKKFLWKNLQHITVGDYNSLNYFVTNAKEFGLRLKTISFYVARKKREAIELICDPQYLIEEYLERIEMTSNVSFEDFQHFCNIIPQKRKNLITFLRVSNDYHLGPTINEEKLIETMYQFPNFSNLRQLYLGGLKNVGSKDIFGNFKELTDLTIRSISTKNVVHFTQDFNAPKLKTLCLTACKWQITGQMKFPKLRNLVMDTVELDNSFSFDQFPLLSQFQYSMNPSLLFTPNLAINFAFTNMKYLRQISVSDLAKVDINNCDALKILKIAKTKEATVYLPNHNLSYLKFENVDDCNLTIDQCEKMFIRFEKYHIININRVKSLYNIPHYMHGTPHDGHYQNISIKQVDSFSLKLSDYRKQENILPSIENIDKMLLQTDTAPNGFSNFFCSPIIDKFTENYIIPKKSLEFLKERITHNSTCKAPSELPLEILSIDTHCYSFSPPIGNRITHLKLSNNYHNFLNFEDFQEFPNLVSLSLRRVRKFSIPNLKYLRNIYFENCGDCKIELSILPALEEMIIFGKETLLSLTSKPGYVWKSMKLVNIYCIKWLNLQATKIEAPNLREFVVTDVAIGDPSTITFKSSPNLIFFYFMNSNSNKSCCLQ